MELGRFRKVYVQMWTDEVFQELSAPQPNAQSCWQRLLTGPETSNVPGVIPCWEGGLADAFRWPLTIPDGGERKGFREVFAELLAAGLAKADWRAGLVFLPKGIVYNPPENPNVIRGWSTNWRVVPECPLKLEAWLHILAWLKANRPGWVSTFEEACSKPRLRGKGFPKGSLQGSAEGSPNGMANQEQEQEQDPEQDLREDRRPPTPIPDAEPLVAESGLSAAGVEELPEVMGELEPVTRVGTILPPAESAPAAPMASAAPPRAPESGTFQLAAPCPPPVAKAPPAPAKTKGEQHRAYAEAYARGMQAASGRPYVPKLGYNDTQATLSVLRTYAREYLPDGPLLHGQELLDWIEKSAADYRTKRPDDRFEGGWNPSRWGSFLSAGAEALRAEINTKNGIQRAWDENKPAWKIDKNPPPLPPGYEQDLIRRVYGTK